MKNILSLTLLAAGLAFVSCKKDHTNTQPPIISIESPADGAIFTATDSIPIRVKVEHPADDIHMVHVYLTKANDESVVYLHHMRDVDKNVYQYETKIAAPPVAEDTQMKLRAKADDHNALIDEKSIIFTLKK